MSHSQKVLKTIRSLEIPIYSKFPVDLRQRFIAEAAYFRAEKRGFAPGFEGQDWAEAEAEIDARLCAESKVSAWSS